jgi:hypothetical protein
MGQTSKHLFTAENAEAAEKNSRIKKQKIAALILFEI